MALSLHQRSLSDQRRWSVSPASRISRLAGQM